MVRVKKEVDDPQLTGEAKTAMHDMADIIINHSFDQLTLERMAMLNADQRCIFDAVQSHLMHQKQHETSECQCDDLKPLRMFISGVGGTDKSFLIEAIKRLVGKIWPLKEIAVAVAAPTGLAAFNVGGLTIHRLFQLPIEHEGKTTEYWSLSKASQKVMKTKLHRVKQIIVDEISKVSSLTLTYMHLRLEELFGGHDWFGCRNMFVGDLQPVNGNPVFRKITQKALLYKLECTASVNIWRDSVVFDELTVNERQKSDAEFATMLDCVRRDCATDETITTLEQVIINIPAAVKFTELQQLGQAPVCLFPTRQMCRTFNNHMLPQLTTKVHELVCTDEVDQTSSTRKWNKKALEQLEKLNDCSRTAGLEAKLLLAVGARVMLRCNIDTKIGLVNGALGTVLSISNDLITVQFDHIGKACDMDRVQTKFLVMKIFFVYRQQFPLILAYAVTIHKCQGLSLDCNC
jgi:ATP-dependent DNA helicase PIF1